MPFILALLAHHTLRVAIYHIKCNLSIQITLLHLWPLLPSTSIVDSKHSASRVKALLCGEVKAT